MASPVAGTVQQVYFRQGELVPAGRPVLAILPPENIKVRFFVPERALPQIAQFYDQIGTMTLAQVAPMSQGAIDDAKLKEIQAEFDKL